MILSCTICALWTTILYSTVMHIIHSTTGIVHLTLSHYILMFLSLHILRGPTVCPEEGVRAKVGDREASGQDEAFVSPRGSVESD